MDFDSLIKNTLEGLKKILPNEVHDTIVVDHYNSAFLQIRWAASNYRVNGVRGQFPLVVSLGVYKADLTLSPQNFGGNGGRIIYFRILPEDNSRNALKGVRLPFRKPQKNEKAMLKAIFKFATNWVKAVKENKNRLPQEDNVNYNWV